MILDYLIFRQLVLEISREIIQHRIRKIIQPNPLDIFFSFGKGFGLRISLKPGLAYLGLDDEAEQKHITPFLLLARKYLEGRKMTSLEVVPGQKIAVLSTGGVSLVVEMPGIRNLIILLDEEGKTLGTLPYHETTLEEKRVLKKGFSYHEPDPPSFNLFLADQPTLEKNWDEIYSGKDKRWWGLHKLHWNILRQRPDGEALKLFLETREDLNLKPFVVYKGEKVEGISLFSPVSHFKPLESSHLHEAVASFFNQETKLSILSENRKRFQSSIARILEKKERKLAALQAEYNEAGRGDEWKECGDLILASVRQIGKGAEVFHDPVEGKEIQLDPKLGAVENAQAYYKKFKKAKNAKVALKYEIEKLSKEIETLLEFDTWVLLAENEEHWEWLESELEKFQPAWKKAKKKTRKSRKEPFLRTATSEGFVLFVGRNVAENVEVLHQSEKEDLWFHAKEIPGGHIVIRVEKKSITEKAIEEAARVAAYYSKGRSWDKVPVDWTQRKEVRPIPGGKAHVTYRNSKTIVVTPKFP